MFRKDLSPTLLLENLTNKTNTRIDETSDRQPSDPDSIGNMAIELLSYKFGIVKKM